MKSKSFINKLSLSNELPLYLLIFPYFINFAISGSEIQGSKLIQISGFGIIASAIPFIVGYIFRRIRLGRLLSFLDAEIPDNGLDIKKIKLGLLRHPLWEGIVIVFRWTIAILAFLAVAIYFFDLKPKEYLSIPYGCFMMIPILFLAFYFQTEVKLIPILKNEIFLNHDLHYKEIKTLTLYQRNLITLFSLTILPIMTLGYYLVCNYLNFIALPNLWFQLPFVFIMMILIIIWTSIVGSNSMNSDIENINQSIISIINGNLKSKIPNISSTNLNITVDKMNFFIEKLDNYFQSVNHESSRLKNQSDILKVNSSDVFEKMQNDKSSLSSISISIQAINQVSSSIMETITNQSERTSGLDNDLASINSNMDKMVEEAKDLTLSAAATTEHSQITQDVVEQALQKVSNLVQSNDRIKETVSIVEEISDQINLLSLNASIEAARAGEYGRGFAVVASEVSRLADKTSENINRIKSIVKDSQAFSKESINAMQEIQAKVKIALEETKSIDDRIQKISQLTEFNSERIRKAKETIHELNSRAGQISKNIIEQSNSTEEINESLEDISSSNELVVQSFEQLKSLSHEIQAISQILDENLREFRLD